MSDTVPVETTYLGIVDGLHVWEVRRTDTGELIGVNQSVDGPDATQA